MTRKTAEHPAAVIFRKRAKSIYAGMKKRAKKEGNDIHFPFSDFEDWLVCRFGLDRHGHSICTYSGRMVTAEDFCIDHKIPISRGGSFGLSNVAICTEKENLCKGNMTGEEWIRLRNYILAMDPAVSESIMRRLSVGDVQRYAHFRRKRKSKRG